MREGKDIQGGAAAPSSRASAQEPPMVTPGNYSDVCPLCGIHRQNAGFLRTTCGDGYRKQGCFIVGRSPSTETAEQSPPDSDSEAPPCAADSPAGVPTDDLATIRAMFWLTEAAGVNPEGKEAIVLAQLSAAEASLGAAREALRRIAEPQSWKLGDPAPFEIARAVLAGGDNAEGQESQAEDGDDRSAFASESVDGPGPPSQWLVERSQPEGQVPTVWIRETWNGRGFDWTEDANLATRFTSRATAEAFIGAHLMTWRGPTARATEHVWIDEERRPFASEMASARASGSLFTLREHLDAAERLAVAIEAENPHSAIDAVTLLAHPHVMQEDWDDDGGGHSCQWCPLDVRDLFALAANAVTNYGTNREAKKMAALKHGVETYKASLEAHFDAALGRSPFTAADAAPELEVSETPENLESSDGKGTP